MQTRRPRCGGPSGVKPLSQSLPFVLIFVLIASAALAKPPLREVEEVRDGLITAGIAIEIDDNCDDISVRLIRGLSYLEGLKRTARDLGYSEAEIDAYVDDKAEKSRLEGMARDWLAERGAVAGDESSYCAIGSAEMAIGSQVGRLLR